MPACNIPRRSLFAVWHWPLAAWCLLIMLCIIVTAAMFDTLAPRILDWFGVSMPREGFS